MWSICFKFSIVLSIKDGIERDTISLQAEHRLEQLKKATDRIQKEIEEVTEREHELRNVGSIKTTSHETVDSKVCLKLHVYVYTCVLRVHTYIRVDHAQGR